MRHTQRGVTLIELLTVVLIIGILASIATPSYRQYMIRANRSEGKAALLFYSSALERCFTRYGKYDYDSTGANGCTVSFPQSSENGLYQITAPTRTGTTFTLTATPQGKQVGDTACGALSVDQLNKRTIGGSKTVAECWGK
jgi:type IV pilus assembly protein PilE